MNLGEKIYQQRTKKKLSQGDLAEILNDSRQSISKWENNSSIPDLDKIVKMSEIFEISLDELIKGETPVIDINDDINNDSIHIKSENKQSKQPSNMKRLTGIILLCMAFIMVMMSLFLGEIMAGLIFASPLIVCGLICLFCNKNAGLWCFWSIYLLMTAYLIWATGITWNVVFLTFIWTPSMNYLRLAIGWVMFVCLIILIFITVKRFSKSCFTSLHSGAMNTAILWISYLCINIGYKYVNQMMFNSIVVDGQIVGDYGMITLSNVLVDCVKLPLITAALISSVRLIRTWKASKITH